jgi:hypothetical protein
MPVYRVHYETNHVGYYGPELTNRTSHHVCLVDAASRIAAFAVAYDHLTKKGLAVSVNLFNPYKGDIRLAIGITEEEAERRELRRKLNALDFTDEDLDQLAELGVPVGGSGADTSITNISEHRITADGTVISEE